MGSEIVRAQPAATGLVPTNMGEAVQLAKAFAASGMFAVRSPEQALVILLTGTELGLGPAQSMRSIYVVDGKPTLSAQLMVALCVRERGVCEYFRCVESTNERACYETKRVGSEPVRLTFTLDDARKAGLTGKGNWSKFPGAMLRARCSSSLARDVYPDLLANLYDPDELGAAPANDAPATEPHAGSGTAMRVAVPCPQAVLDDCGSWSTEHEAFDHMPIAAGAAILADHWHSLGAEQQASAFDHVLKCCGCPANKLEAARKAEVARREPPAQPAPAGRSDDDEVPAYTPEQAERDYAAAKSRDEVTAIDAEVAALGLAKNSPARKSLIAARKAALARLTPPDDGTDPPARKGRQANDAGDDAERAAIEAEPADATVARKREQAAALKAYVDGKANRYEVEHGIAKHRREWNALDDWDVMHVAVPRLVELGMSEGTAVNSVRVSLNAARGRKAA